MARFTPTFSAMAKMKTLTVNTEEQQQLSAHGVFPL